MRNWSNHSALVYAAARRQVGASLAEDVAQAVFLVALRKEQIGALPEERYMAGWLLRVTGYVVKELRRAEAKRRHTHSMETSRISASLEPPELAAHQEIAEVLDDALLRLGRMDREVLLRRYLRDEPVHVVAAGMGMSDNTASRRIARALEKMRKTLARRGVIAPAVIVAATMAAEGHVHATTIPTTAVSSTMAQRLARSVLRKMAVGKMATVATATIALLMTTAGTAWIAMHMESGATAAMPMASSALATPVAELTVTRVLEGHSDALLHSIFVGIRDCRAKMKTLYVEGVESGNVMDANNQRQVNTWFIKGRGWYEAERSRSRIEVFSAQGDNLGIPEKARGPADLEIFDGTSLYRECFDDLGNRTVFEKKDGKTLLDDGVIGDAWSTQLRWETTISAKLGFIAVSRVLPKSEIEQGQLRARRVLLNNHQEALEFQVDNEFEIRGRHLSNINTCWFDAKRGFALLGSHFVENGVLRSGAVIDTIAEAGPGVFYPTKAHSTFWQTHGVVDHLFFQQRRSWSTRNCREKRLSGKMANPTSSRKRREMFQRVAVRFCSRVVSSFRSAPGKRLPNWA